MSRDDNSLTECFYAGMQDAMEDTAIVHEMQDKDDDECEYHTSPVKPALPQSQQTASESTETKPAIAA